MKNRAAEAYWEKKLNIETGAARHEKDDRDHSRYEPTPYAVLERLAESGWIGRENVFVDYGCGKGRASFFMNYMTGCRSIGVEYDAKLHAEAEENRARYPGKGEMIEFVHENAERFDTSGADCFYFFNPFSVRILMSVLGRIYDSYYENPRCMKLMFYYPLDEYMSCLLSEEQLRYAGGIDCRDLFFNENRQERIELFVMDQPG